MAKIYVYPADRWGCGHLRLIWPARAVAALGHDVTVVMPRDRTVAGLDIRGVMGADGELRDVQVPADADVVVMQRITWRRLAQSVAMMRRQGVAVVVDIDDDLAHVHPKNPAFTSLHPRTPGDHAWRYAFDACRDATMVTVSTDALLPTYAPHGRGRVLRNCVPARYLRFPRVDGPVVGWAGNVMSHPDDLPVMGGAVARLVGEGATFRVVGAPQGVREALRLPTEPQGTGDVPVDRWAEEISTLGIGVAPLSDTRFNRGKSHLKILEYSAAGVPWVASPRAEYQRLHRAHGIGLLAERPRDWYAKLSRLVREPQLRADMSAAGRAAAAALTIEANAWRWAETWLDALRTQRQAASSAFART